MKKLFALILCMVLVMGLFAGCGPQGSTRPQGNPDGDGAAGPNAKGTLTIGIPISTNVEDYDTNAYTRYLEETSGYNLEFYTFMASNADYKAQLTTMLLDPNSELPDILWRFRGLDNETIRMYGEDGYFLDMSEYLADKEKSANFWNLLGQCDEAFQERVIDLMTEDDGSVYALPSLDASVYDSMKYTAYINTTWLKKLNLEMPTDPESLYQVLKAFKTQDPNGNGKADEYPLLGFAEGNPDVINWITNMFEYVDNAAYWNIDANGKLLCPYTTDKYREALIYLNKLVKEGLLSTAVYAMSSSEMKYLLNPTNGVDTVGVWVGHPTSLLEVDHPSVFEYAALPIWGYAVRREYTNRYDIFITEGCEDPDAAWELLMTAYTWDAATRMRYGEYGVDWVDADPGATSFVGWPAKIKVINEDAYAGINNQTWHTISGTMLLAAENEECQLDENSSEWVKAKMKMMGDAYTYFVKAENEHNPKYMFKGMIYPTEEAEATDQLRDNVRNVFKTMRAKFICGTDGADPNDDAQWAAYLQEIQNKGYKEYYEQAQRIYDTYYKGK